MSCQQFVHTDEPDKDWFCVCGHPIDDHIGEPRTGLTEPRVPCRSCIQGREVTVPSALHAHQLRQWLKIHGIEVAGSRAGGRGTETILTVVATEEQRVQINQWLEKVKA